jgi:hypothetical protein
LNLQFRRALTWNEGSNIESARDLLLSEPEDLALLRSLVFLRMEEAMTRPTMSIWDPPAWIDSST